MKKVIVTYIAHQLRHHNRTLRDVIGFLKKRSQLKVLERQHLSRKHFDGADLVVTVGGDGTFLRTSHFVKDEPVLGINSDISSKEGYFTRADHGNYRQCLTRALDGKYRVNKLLRLQVLINSRPVPDLALNEVYIGYTCRYHTLNFELMVRKRKERQRATGIFVGTPAGSTAWIRSAGGKIMPLGSKRFQFLVREPYRGRIHKPTLLKGILNNDEQVKVTCLSEHGVLMIDSLTEERSFKRNDTITVKAAKNPLKLVSFD
ncbi:MAG: NAD(+)/NADH kinase [Nanoarchaeota archaeon]|nr:NAD(+)/NADH kinase [Nanoarchaeota archaeon]